MENKSKEKIVPPEELRRQLAVSLRTLRTNAGLTQEAVAGLLQISRPTYSYYELGNTTPSIPMLYQLSQFYGISPETLFVPGAIPDLFPGKKRVRGKPNPRQAQKD